MSVPDLDPTEQEKAAIRTIALSPEGALLHRYLRRVLEGVMDIQTDGALQSHNGRRSLARDMMRLMAEGLDDRTDDTTDTILARNAGGPTVVSPRRGAGRRISADTPVAGYDAADR